MKNILYEILVPTMYGDTKKPISTRHHKNWDRKVLKITSGLTICSPSKGKWVFQNEDFFERVIPVRIFCSENDMEKIVEMSLTHYRQIAIMFYVVSEKCEIRYQK